MLKYIERLNQGAAAIGGGRNARPIFEKVSPSRRGFLIGSASLTGFVLAMQLPGSAKAFEPYKHGGLDMPHGVVVNPALFVKIAPDGQVTLVTIRSEMGTGARTNTPMVLADEMEADWSRVTLEQAPGDEPTYGNQDTDGSRSLRHYIQPMREMGGAVRTMLERAAAEKWGVDPKLARAELHEVHQLDESGAKTGEKLGYGELAEAAMAQDVPSHEEITFKTDEQFRYLGKGEVPLYDLRDITTGAAVYGADIRVPGMKYAVAVRPPVVGGKVKSYDAEAAKQVPGVVAVVELPASIPPAKFAPLGGVAVVADSTWAAIKGRDALTIEWDDGPHAIYNTETYKMAMSETAKQPGKVIRAVGDADKAFSEAAQVVSAEYYQPHMAHTAMEPVAAVASVADGKVEIWAPVQSPYGARQDVAAMLGVDEADVTVHVTLLGGGFGRKSKCDFVLEAALLSREVGAPVLMQWMREDDVANAFYHTTSVERIEAAVDGDGKVTGWRHRSVAPSIITTFAEDSGYQFPVEYGMGFVDNPFEIANMSMENGQAMAHTRIGWFRSVSNIPRAFAVQSFVGELAAALGKDPKDMLLELIGSDRVINREEQNFPEDHWNYGEPYDEFPIDTARLKNVVNMAADMAGWGSELPKGEGLGVAVHRSFVSYVASVVRVKVGDDGVIRVPAVYTAFDCGFCVNPDRLRGQVEGAAVMGHTLALYSAITYTDGRVDQSNFHDYQMARISNYPEKVEVGIVEHPFSVHATGVGEPGVPPYAPALANAIFAATGKRLRELPFGDTLA